MITRHKSHDALWIDLESPTPEEIAQVAHELRLGEHIRTEIEDPTPMSLVLPEHDAILLVLHWPSGQEDDLERKSNEIDLVAGKGFVLTVHYELVPAFHDFLKLFEANELLGATAFRTDELLELILTKLFGSLRGLINRTAHMLEKVENEMFTGGERATVRAISSVNRTFLELEATLASQEEPLTSFLRALERHEFFGTGFGVRVERVLGEREQVLRLLAAHQAVAAELRETNLALLNAAQNEIMKTLTVVTFIFLPLELVAGLFAMDTVIPFANNPNAFWIIVGIMLVIALVLTFFFARKRWL